MASTTKLIVYNDTLRELGSHPLSSTSDVNGGTRLQELNGAFDHAVEYMLARVDWNFARRRATLTGVADTSLSPYTYRYARPSDYLRKLWIKSAADDDFQVEHAEVGAVFYGFATTALIEYMSDHADNYEPANWPPQFTRCVVLYLAMLVGPKLGRTGDDDAKAWYQKLDIALADAERIEALYTPSVSISTDRLPVMRRAIEFLGQQLVGSPAIHAQTDQLRWHMNRSWVNAVKYVLSQAAWNFATKRAVFDNGDDADSVVPTDSVAGIIEGYSVGTATSDDISIAGFAYGYPLPDNFLHKIWIKADVHSDYETSHQIMKDYIFTDTDTAIMEYVAYDDWIADPDNWPVLFMETVAAYLALIVTPEVVIEETGKGKSRVNVSQLRDKLEATYMRKLSDAKIKDAIQQEPKTIPLGRFARARFGSIGTTSIRRYN